MERYCGRQSPAEIHQGPVAERPFKIKSRHSGFGTLHQSTAILVRDGNQVARQPSDDVMVSGLTVAAWLVAGLLSSSESLNSSPTSHDSVRSIEWGLV